MKHVFPIIALLGLGACASPSLQGIFPPPDGEAEPVVGGAAAPNPLPAPTLDPTPPPPPPQSAVTVEQFDTTTAEDREEAQVIEATVTEAELGTTIASLGPPTEPGIWLKTPLVDTLTPGIIEYQGKRINVELRPSGGAEGSGSQISLAAMRLIEAPLTSLPQITVFSR